MIRIYNQNYIFDNSEKGMEFRPADNFLLLINQGSLKLNFNNQIIDFGLADLSFIYNSNVYTLIDYSEDLQLYILYIDRDEIKSKVNLDFSTYDAYRIISLERRVDLFPIVKQDFEHLWGMLTHLDYYLHQKQSRFRERVILNMTATIIYILVEHLFEGLHLDVGKNPRQEEIAVTFLKLLSKHYKEERELGFYADKMNMSVKYLSISIKAITDCPPSVFITNSTLDEAKRLLVQTSDHISSISNDLNFSDQYAFGKFFKKHTSLSPLNYRKKLKDLHTI